jgi:hypothetical protein
MDSTREALYRWKPSVRDSSFYVSGLLELHNVSDGAERKAMWRQSMAALARATADDGPGPLDGLHPDALVRGVRAALGAHLVDDLDWLEPAAAGAALYALASALPIGPEQRDLGRRVLARLLAANASSFVALATRMALSSGKGLGTGPVRARIALVAELPIGIGIADERLALALVSRRELAREWIAEGSVGSLAARRLSARLLERAAREAAKRASQGDAHALRVFSSDAVKEAWGRLLGDRESLVWRHVAVARGLLAPWIPDLHAQMEDSLAPRHTPTEWRRGATSIAAFIAVNPEAAMRLASIGLSHGVLTRDPGAASAFIWGMPRAAEGEPEAAKELLNEVLVRASPDVAEAILELRSEFGDAPFVEHACARALAMLQDRGVRSGHDDGAEALTREMMRDLEREPREDPTLRAQVSKAMGLFATEGARAAYLEARKVLASMGAQMGTLEAVSHHDDGEDGARSGSMARRASLAVLRDLDATLLEQNCVSDLLHLGAGAEGVRQHDEALDTVRERLSEWILARESKPLPATGVAVYVGGEARPSLVTPSHPTLRLRRLRALLHLVDGDVEDPDGDPARAERLRKRWLRTAKALLGRFERDPPSILRRTILAALARALDALVRAGQCDVSDVLLVVVRKMTDPAELDTLAEASMAPDLIHVLTRYAEFVRGASTPGMASRTKPHDSLLPPSVPLSIAMPNLLSKLAAMESLSQELSPDASTRTEALRTVIVRLRSAMSSVVSANSLKQLAGAGGADSDVIVQLETALVALSQLAAGARARLDPERVSAVPPSMAAVRPLSVGVSRVLSGAEPSLSEHVLSASVDELAFGVPTAIASIATAVIWGIADLPIERPSAESAAIKLTDGQLPPWIPTRRTIGGFYVVKPLGGGGSGSVFIVVRLEEKGEPNAERFALKVPEYSAIAARMISEAQFSNMFRSEASALMAIPPHPNLARFVTFDAGAKPKPILVMEFVEGPTLERLIESRALDVKRALRILDDILAGLEAMHEVGVGHLDLKPGNIVLRKEDEDAVLVDFGLAGRHIRPGCATGPYGAPEVWGALPTESPSPADVYAFGCLAYETLSGQVLFHADNELAQIALHVAHDGTPPPIKLLLGREDTKGLGELLASALRREPRQRASASALRESLRALAPRIGTSKWPLLS